MNRKSIFSLIVIAMLLLISACGGGGSSNVSSDSNNQTTSASESKSPSYTLNVATALTESDPIYQGLVKFKENVESRTNGDVLIEIFGSGSLGDDSDILEQAKAGANVAVISDSGRLAEMVPEIGILAAPYIADNYEEAAKIVESDLFKSWGEELARDHNLQIISFNWYQGERHLLTNKPIETPEDLKGLQLRTPGTPVMLETISAMGASPTGMPWTEVYPGIQAGVIDGAEAQHPATYGAKLHEVISYITKTAHFQLLTGLIAGTDWMESLPADYQEIIYEEASKAGSEASLETVALLNDFEQKMIDEGVTVNEVDIEPFKERTSVVYEKFDGYKELRDEINKLLGK